MLIIQHVYCEMCWKWSFESDMTIIKSVLLSFQCRWKIHRRSPKRNTRWKKQTFCSSQNGCSRECIQKRFIYDGNWYVFGWNWYGKKIKQYSILYKTVYFALKSDAKYNINSYESREWNIIYWNFIQISYLKCFNNIYSVHQRLKHFKLKKYETRRWCKKQCTKYYIC